jgi:hypothetical protein
MTSSSDARESLRLRRRLLRLRRLPRKAKREATAALYDYFQDPENNGPRRRRRWRPSISKLWRARMLLVQLRKIGNICPYTKETLYDGDVDELDNLLRQGIVPKGLFDKIHLEHLGKGWSYDVIHGLRDLTVESYLRGIMFCKASYNIRRTQDTPASVPINNVVPVEWRHCVEEWPWAAPPARFKEIWERYVETGELPSPPASCRTRLF